MGKKRASKASHKREQALIAELQNEFGYMIADTLASKDKISMVMTTDANGKRLIKAALGVKLVVPSDGYVGKLIQNMRDGTSARTAKAKDGRKAKAA